MTTIDRVGERDLDDLLPLMRGYCDFYGAAPPDARLLEMARALIADPEREGVQLIARADEGRAAGFATVFWSWSTLGAARRASRNAGRVATSSRSVGRRRRTTAVRRRSTSGSAPGARSGWTTRWPV